MMDGRDRERLIEIVGEAAAKPPDEREAWVRSACQNMAMQEEALGLLGAFARAGGFMERPTVAGGSGARGHLESIGSVIGRYTLVEVLGEGGFGTVFRAEQHEPVARQVALKVIKLGMDTRQVIARFEAERQALAMMDHPNIARVFDAGATEAGRPYFVMELVRGEPITVYCDRNNLSTTERLKLFETVCLAVQHAHQKGIIHRDIKPANVLVSEDNGRRTPKVIDFGIAKATSAKLTEKTLFTLNRQLIGTPEYMSPEQAGIDDRDIDTRSDVYSLGVLLYELLTGATPFDPASLRSAAWGEMQRIIREEDPPKPSTRLSGMKDSLPVVAAQRRTEPGRLTSMVRGDLDWIVMKCLEKDRTRRYGGAADLALDIARFMDHQPVSAAPPSAGYRMSKFARRHRVGVAAGVAILVTLVGATGVSVTFAMREARERAAAEEAGVRAARAEEAERGRANELARTAAFQSVQLSSIDAAKMGADVRKQLIEAVRTASAQSGLPPERIEARVADLEGVIAGSDFTGLALRSLKGAVFDPALPSIRREFADQPLVRARLLQAIADAYRAMGLLGSALDPQQEALTLRQQSLGDKHQDTLTSVHSLGMLLLAQGKLAEARTHLAGALQARRDTLGPQHADTLDSMAGFGLLLFASGDHAAAEQHLRDALDGRRRVLGEEDPRTLSSIQDLADVLFRSESLQREAMEKRRRVLGDDHPDTIYSIDAMGQVLLRRERPAWAEPYFREALDRRRRTLGEDHPATIASMCNLALTLIRLNQAAEAGRLGRQAMAGAQRLLGEHHPETLSAVAVVGRVLVMEGRASEGVSVMSGFRSAAEQAFVGDNIVRLGHFLTSLGRAEGAAGDFEGGATTLGRALDVLRNSPGAPDWNCIEVMPALESLYTAWDKAEPGKGHDRRAAEWRREWMELQQGARRGDIKPIPRRGIDGQTP